MKFNYIILLVVLTYNLEAHFLDSLRVEVKNGKKYIVHRISTSETLYSLSKKYRVPLDDILKANDFESNSIIHIDQIIFIPYNGSAEGVVNNNDVKKTTPTTTSKLKEINHKVAAKENLYRISKKYGVSIGDILRWNNLSSNELSEGQVLKIYTDESTKQLTDIEVDKIAVTDSNVENPENIYIVQTGETLLGISQKTDVSIDSIRKWNNLISDNLSIGQNLYIPFVQLRINTHINSKNPVVKQDKTAYNSTIVKSKEGGVVEVREEGIATRISVNSTSTKYLALHRTLKINTIFKVKNYMNNEIINVRVVGKLPNTGENEGVMVRFTPSVFQRLNIKDEKALVEIIYFED